MNNKEYVAGLKFLLYVAVKELYNGDVLFHHSLDKGIYTTIKSDTTIGKEEVNKIKEYMKSLVEKDIPIEKKMVTKKDAYNYFKNKNIK